jgi:hypothetical protein
MAAMAAGPRCGSGGGPGGVSVSAGRDKSASGKSTLGVVHAAEGSVRAAGG